MCIPIQPGDFIYMQNLHAAQRKFSAQDANIVPTIEFCLHRGTWYGRKIERLNPDVQSVKKLKLLLWEVADGERFIIKLNVAFPYFPVYNIIIIQM